MPPTIVGPWDGRRPTAALRGTEREYACSRNETICVIRGAGVLQVVLNIVTGDQIKMLGTPTEWEAQALRLPRQAW